MSGKKNLSANWAQNKCVRVCVYVCVFSHSVMSNSLLPHGPHANSLPGSSVHGMDFFSAKIMEWVVGNDKICDIF